MNPPPVNCETITSEKACSHVAPSEGIVNNVFSGLAEETGYTVEEWIIIFSFTTMVYYFVLFCTTKCLLWIRNDSKFVVHSDCENEFKPENHKNYNRSVFQKICLILWKLWRLFENFLYFLELCDIVLTKIALIFVVISLFSRAKFVRSYLYYYLWWFVVPVVIFKVFYLIICMNVDVGEIRDYVKDYIVFSPDDCIEKKEEDLHFFNIKECKQCKLCKLDFPLDEVDDYCRFCEPINIHGFFVCGFCGDKFPMNGVHIIRSDYGNMTSLCDSCHIIYAEDVPELENLNDDSFVVHSDSQNVFDPLHHKPINQTCHVISQEDIDKMLNAIKIARENGDFHFEVHSDQPSEFNSDEFARNKCSQEICVKRSKIKIHKASRGMAPKLQNYGFADGCGFTVIRPKIDPKWKCPTGIVFEEPFYRGIELNSFLLDLTFDHVDQLIGSYCTLSPSKFESFEQKQLFIDFKRGLCMVRRKWNQSESGVRCLRDFLAAYQTVQKYDNRTCLSSAPPNQKFEKHNLIRFQKIPDEFFQNSGKGKFILEPLLIQSCMSRNILYTIIEKCNVKSQMLTVQKIKSVCSQYIKDKKTREELLEYFETRCYIWRKNWKEPNYSSLSWLVPYVPIEWYSYHVRDDEEFLQLFRNLALELRNCVLQFVNRYFDVSLMSVEERASLKKNRIMFFREQMKAPDIQERFLAGEDKQQIVDSIYANNSEDIFSDAMKTNEMVHFSDIKVRDRIRKIKKERDKKYGFDNFEVHSWNGIFVGSTIFSFFLYFVYLRMLELLNKLEPHINRLSVTTDKATRIVDKTVQNAIKIDNVIGNFEKFFSEDSIPAEYRMFVTALKILITSIYFACKGDFSLAANEISHLPFLYPSLLIKLKDKILSFSTPKQTKDDEFNVHAEPTFIAPFIDIINVFKTEDLTKSEMSEANVRFQYIFNSKRFWDDKVSMLKGIASWLGRELFDYDPFDKDYDIFSRKLLSQIEYIDKVLLEEKNMITDHMLCKKVLSVYKECTELNNSVKMNLVSTHLRSIFADRFKHIQRMAVNAEPILKGTVKRAEPLSLLFTGPPEVGKSTAIEAIMQGLSVKNGFDFDQTCVFNVNLKNEHQDTYNNQYHCWLDEVFMNADPKVRAEHAEMIIKMINTAPHPLTIAKCEDKGQVFFNSRVLYLTTNVANEGYQICQLQAGLQDNEAFWRRMHLIIHREEKYNMENDIYKTVFIVHKCRFFPEFEKKKMTVEQIVHLAYKCQKRQDELRNCNMHTKEKLESMFKPQSLASEMVVYANQYFSVVKSDDNYKNLFYGLIILSSTLAIGYGIYSMFTQNEFESQAYSTEQYSKKYPKPHLTKQMKQAIVDRKFKVQDKRNNFLSSCLALCKCLTHVQISVNGLIYSDSKFTHIKDGYFVGCAHAIREFQGFDAKIKMVWSGGELEFTLPVESIIAEGEDLYMFKIPDMSKLPKSIYNHIITADKWEDPLPGRALKLLFVTRDGQPDIVNINRAAFDHALRYKHSGFEYMVERPLTYFGEYECGHSGGIVVAECENGMAKVVAMHCGEQPERGTAYGVSLPFHKESFDHMFSVAQEKFRVQNLTTNNFPFTEYRITDKVHHVPRKMTLVPSRMYGWKGEPKKIPAMMNSFVSNGVEIDPLVEALKKLSQDRGKPIVFSERMYSWFLNMYNGGKEFKFVLTTLQSLQGIPEMGIPSIILNTSPGWPKNLRRNKGKSPYIYRDEDGLLQFETTFLKELNDDLEKLKRGDPIEVVFCDLLKVETRDVAKVLEGKTRLFSACPLNFLILIRMYFLAFSIYIQSKASTHPISVGIDPHSLDWQKLRSRLLSKAMSIISGDFKNYDGTVHEALIWAFCRLVNMWYDDGEENAEIRRRLIYYIVNSTHVIYEFIYQLSHGNPSGNPFTSILNSVCLMIIMYIVLTEDFNCREDEFELAVYGDDNVVSVMKEGLTALDFVEPIKRRFNMDYTHSSKQNTNIVDTIDTITYLGRKFVMRDNICHAPLNYSVIVESIYWLDRTEESVAMISSAQSLAVEASHLSRQDFMILVREFLEAVRERMPDLYNIIKSSIKSYDYYYDSKYTSGKHVNFGFRIQSMQMNDFCSENLSRDVKSIVVLIPEINNTQNTDITNRDPITSEPVQNTRIGEYDDANPVVLKDSTVLRPAHRDSTMEVYKLDNNLTREYQVGTFTVSSSQGANTLIGSLAFPQVLFNVTFIESMVKFYQFFRAGVEISIRTSSSKFNYGMLLVDWYPFKLGVDTNVDTSQVRTGRDSGLLRYEECNTLIMRFPFIHPHRFLDTTSYSNDEIGLLSLSVKFPLTNINGNFEQVTVFVTARFVEPELVFPFYTTTVSLMSREDKQKQKPKEIEYDFIVHSKEANRKAKK